MLNPAIDNVIQRIAADAIGGAADIAMEVVAALEATAAAYEQNDGPPYVEALQRDTAAILDVLPSFAPPINALHYIHRSVEANESDDPESLRQVVLQAAQGFRDRATEALHATALHGARLLRDQSTILTSSMSSTVWRMLLDAQQAGLSFRVIVAESRPGNEGMETVRVMQEHGIPVQLTIDSCVGELTPLADLVVVGADAISGTGTALCKVGTLPLALVARHSGVPFYLAADTLKFDTTSLQGFPFRVDPLPKVQVLDATDEGLDPVDLIGTLFDSTPPHLITGVICEMGVLSPHAFVSAARTEQSEFVTNYFA